MARKEYSEEEVQKRIDKLSEEAADFLYSTEMGAMIKRIADGHKLHIDQMALLEAEVGELMLGLTEPQEFVPNMIQTLQVTEETAQAIAKDINDQVMTKMRGLMGAPSLEPTPPVPTPRPAVPTAPSSPIIPTPSVVMPSSPKPVVSPASQPAPVAPTTPAMPPVATPAPTVAPVPDPVHDLVAADAMLSEKKVVPPPAAAPTAPTPAAPSSPAGGAVVKADPAQPQNYKADPYREPVE